MSSKISNFNVVTRVVCNIFKGLTFKLVPVWELSWQERTHQASHKVNCGSKGLLPLITTDKVKLETKINKKTNVELKFSRIEKWNIYRHNHFHVNITKCLSHIQTDSPRRLRWTDRCQCCTPTHPHSPPAPGQWGWRPCWERIPEQRGFWSHPVGICCICWAPVSHPPP